MQFRNILFKKKNKEYFLKDFAIESEKLNFEKRKPLDNFIVKNQSHRNFLIKNTYKYSLKLVKLINQDLLNNYKVYYTLNDLNKFLMPWAHLYVAQVYSIYQRSKSLKKNNYRLIIQNYKFRPERIDKRSYQSFNLYYEFWKDIFYYSSKNQKKNQVYFYNAFNYEYKSINILKNYFSQLLIFIGKIFHKKVILFDYNFGIKNTVKLILKSGFKYCFFFPKVKKYRNLKIRSFPTKHTFNDEFLSLLFDYYKKYIFSDYMNILFYSRKEKNDSKLLTGNLMNLSPLYRDFFLINSQIKIYGIQHGGGYCVDQNNLSEIIEKKISNNFVSWGKNFNANKIAMPEILKKEYFKTNQTIFYVSTSPPRCLLRFDDNIFPQYVKNNYFKDKYEIIEQLSKNKLKTIVRLDKNDYWSHNEYLNKKIKFRNIIIDDGKFNFVKNLKKSSLNLFDYLGSTYLLSLALNKPTIIYCNKKFLFILKRKKKFFDALKKKSIFFDDLNKLTHFLEKMDDEEKIKKWWENSKLQFTLKKFNQEFRYSSKNWDKEIIKKFS